MKVPLLLSAILVGTACAQTTNYVASPFNSQNHYGTQDPFLFFTTDAPSARYQQVYAGSDFRQEQGPVVITEISFSSGALGLDITVPNVQMNLSTSPKVPDGLSTTFSKNVGPDNTLVFSGPLHLFSRGFSTYGVTVPLQHPFFYDPDVGNLLLDVRNFQTISPTANNHLLLADSTLGDSSSLAVALDVNFDTALLGTGALLTEFTVVSVPEPGLAPFFVLGIGFLGLFHSRSRATSSLTSKEASKGDLECH